MKIGFSTAKNAILLVLLCVISAKSYAQKESVLSLKKQEYLTYLSIEKINSNKQKAINKIDVLLSNLVWETKNKNFEFQEKLKKDKNSILKFNSKNQVEVVVMVNPYLAYNGLNFYKHDLEEKFHIKITGMDERTSSMIVFVDPSILEALSKLSYINALTIPSYAIHNQEQPANTNGVNTGDTVQEGVEIHKASQLHDISILGNGVRIGVISDGVLGLSDAKKSFDLPENVEDLSTYNCDPTGSYPGACAEGTAMMELIYDLAPNATLGFCGVGSSFTFQSCISRLFDDFKADIVVDDLSFFGQPYFEASSTTISIESYVNQGKIYVTSAGNYAKNYYENDFITKEIKDETYESVHQFSENDSFQTFKLKKDRRVDIFLQWNDHFFEAINDFDISLINIDTEEVLDTSQSNQYNAENIRVPFEVIHYYNETGKTLNLGVNILKKKGSENKRLKMFILGASPFYATPSGSIFGQAASLKVMAIGAVEAKNEDDPEHNKIENYSSLGNTRIDFPVLEFRNKPDLAAVDGVMVSGAGGFGYEGTCGNEHCFYGTSAAAPQIAGLLALLKSAFKGADSNQIKSAILSGATPTGEAKAFGSGFANVLKSAQLLNQPPVSSYRTNGGTYNFIVGENIKLLGSCFDPESLSINNYKWDFGSSELIEDTKQNPSIQKLKTAGEFFISLSCTDSFGLSSTPYVQKITVKKSNSLPTAHAISLSVSNDSSIGITLVGNDADGDTLTYQMISNPTHGTLSGVAPNLFYTPSASFYGEEGWSYAVSDGFSVSAPATIVVNVTKKSENSKEKSGGSISLFSIGMLFFLGSLKTKKRSNERFCCSNPKADKKTNYF